MSNVFHKDFIDDNNHALTARTYVDLAARDSDSLFQVAANLDKMVLVESESTYYILSGVGPAVWIASMAPAQVLFLEHSDTPSSFVGQALKPLRVNAAEDSIEFGPQPPPPSVGGLVSRDNAAVVSIVQGVWTDFNQGATTLPLAFNQDWSLESSATAEIKYTGTTPFLGVYLAAITFIPAGKQNYFFRLLKQGTTLPSPDPIWGSVGSSGDAHAVSICVPVQAALDDLFRLQVQNVDGSDDVNINQLSVALR